MTIQALIAALLQCTHLLIQYGTLNSEQDHFMQALYDNAQILLDRYEDFATIPHEQVASQMRHDLGNPLTPIFGYTQLILAGKVGVFPPETLHHVQQALDLARALRQALDDLTISSA